MAGAGGDGASTSGTASRQAKAKGVAVDGLTCPITCEVMRDPVLLAGDGHTYERHAITQWLRRSDVSPMTGATIPEAARVLVPNHAMRKAIADLGLELPEAPPPEVPREDEAEAPWSGPPAKAGGGIRAGRASEAVVLAMCHGVYSYNMVSSLYVARASDFQGTPQALDFAAIDTPDAWPHSCPSQVTCMASLPASSRVVSGARDKLLRVWCAPESSPAGALPGLDAPPSGRLAPLRLERSLEGHLDWVTGLGASDDGEVVVSTGRDNTVRLWDALKWRCKHVAKTEDDANCVCYAPAEAPSPFFVTGGSDWKDIVWDPHAMQPTQVYTEHTYAVRCCAVDPTPGGGARWFVSGGDDSKVCVFDVRQRHCAVTIEEAGGVNADAVTCCAISPDGALLATGTASDDHAIALWDCRMWKRAGGGTLRGHAYQVASLAFLPLGAGASDGHALLSTDGKALWSWSGGPGGWSGQQATKLTKAYFTSCNAGETSGSFNKTVLR